MFRVQLEERRELWELPSTCIHLSVAFLFLSSCYYIFLVVPAFLFFEFQPRRVGEMYAEQGLLLPYMLGFPQEVSGVDQHLLPFTACEDLVSADLPNYDPYMVCNTPQFFSALTGLSLTCCFSSIFLLRFHITCFPAEI